VPGVAQTPLPSHKSPGVVGPKLLTPLLDGLIGDGDASLGKKIFHFAKTEAEAVVEPDGMTDDFGWKAVTVIEGWFGIHQPSLSNLGQLDNAVGRAHFIILSILGASCRLMW